MGQDSRFGRCCKAGWNLDYGSVAGVCLKGPVGALTCMAYTGEQAHGPSESDVQSMNTETRKETSSIESASSLREETPTFRYLILALVLLDVFLLLALQGTGLLSLSLFAVLLALPVLGFMYFAFFQSPDSGDGPNDRSPALSMKSKFIERHWDAVIYSTLAGDVHYCNPAASGLFRLSAHEMVGQNIKVLFGEKRYLFDIITTELSKSNYWQGETTLTNIRGEAIRTGVWALLLRDEANIPNGLAWSFRDITETKNAERELRLSEKRFKSMAVNAPGIIFEWRCSRDGSDLGFNYMSPRMDELFGLSAERCQSDTQELIQVIHSEDKTAFRDSIGAVTRELNGWNHKFRLVLPERGTRWLRGVATPIDCDDSEVIFHGILMDITQEVDSQRELIAAKERAEVAIKEKSNFLSTMSHEIRTPLNAVIGLSHLLLEEVPETHQLANLKTLKFSAENLLALINDILDFNKIEAGRIELERIPMSLQDLARSILASLEFQAEHKGLDLRLILDPAIPDQVLADKIRLGQVLNNLISNALKFTEAGFVELKIKAVQQWDSLVRIRFTVQDSGIGIDPDQQRKVFEFFNQGDNSVTRKYGGTGLGLAITRGILQLYHSDIQLQSVVGEGSVFSFELELPVGLSEHEEAMPAGEFQTHASLEGSQILLVEDNRVNVMVATKLLSKWGARIDVALDGEDAVRKVQEKDYDLVLMDIQMPNMDGYQATQEIRKLHGKYERLPIIALTATVLEEVQNRVQEVGLNGILSKPIKPGELKSQIIRYLH